MTYIILAFMKYKNVIVGSSVQEKHEAPGAGPAEVAKVMKGLQHVSREDRLRELGAP